MTKTQRRNTALIFLDELYHLKTIGKITRKEYLTGVRDAIKQFRNER